jgi:hypothetical protein
MNEQPEQIASSKDGAYWRQQVDLALAKRRTYEAWWDACMKKYAPSTASGPEQYGSEVHTNRTFTLTERKKADLFYQRPDVTLQPTPLMEGPIVTDQIDPMTGQPAPLMGQPNAQGQAQPIPASYALAAHEEIVNEKLGEDGIDATDMMDAVLFDIICTQAVGFTKMGYESFTVPQETMDPLTGEPVSVDVPVAERCFWEHFSGKQAVIPADFRSSKWDRARFLGVQFELPLTAGNRTKFNLPPEFKGTNTDKRQYYDHGDTSDAGGEQVFTGVELWAYSIYFREDVAHPDHMTQIVLVDGIPEPVIQRDSPYQTLTPQGTLTPDSLIGSPIHPFSTRKLTDAAYVPSDATMILPLENELDVFRTQMVQFRDAQTLRFIANGDVLPIDALQKIVRSPIGGITVVPSEAFVGEGAIKPLEGGSMPRESFQSNDYIDNDMARTTAVDSAASGVQSDKSSTATEQQIVASNANARMDKERATILKRYIKGVTKFSTLIQRYLPVADAAAIVGPQRASAWDAWRKTANSALAFTAMPDSALRVDQAVDRKDSRELYSFLANDPYIQKGRAKLLEKLLRKHHVDPTGIVAPPDPGKPEPPKLALSFKGEDLIGPQAPIVIEILQQQGITISPQNVQLSQAMLQQSLMLAAQAGAAEDAQAEGNTQHGGKLPQQESLSKHAADKTGGMQGVGGTAAMGAAGGHLQ